MHLLSPDDCVKSGRAPSVSIPPQKTTHFGAELCAGLVLSLVWSAMTPAHAVGAGGTIQQVADGKKASKGKEGKTPGAAPANKTTPATSASDSKAAASPDGTGTSGSGASASGSQSTSSSGAPPVAPAPTTSDASAGGSTVSGELSPAELEALTQSLAADAQTSKPTTTAPVGAGAAQSMNPDMALILDTALAGFSQADNLQGGGHDPTANGFNLQQLELSFSSNVDPYFGFNANLVFGPEGFELEEAYVSTLALPANLKVRAGKFLTKFGRLNSTHPHGWSFVDQPVVNGQFLGGDGKRGLGAEVSWLSPLPWFLEVTGSANSAEAEEEEHARQLPTTQLQSIPVVTDLFYTGVVKQFFPFTNDLSLMWGLSGQLSPLDGGFEHGELVAGTDFYLRYRPTNSPNGASLSLSVELMARQADLAAGAPLETGAYGQLVWRINPAFEAGLRSEVMQQTLEGVEGLQSRTRHTGALTYYPSHFSRLRLQGSYDAPAWLAQPIFAGFLALEVVVGAHGSHSY